MNTFDSAAWYLLTYSNTLSFDEWRQAVKQTYLDLEKQYGTASASSLLNRMVAYYCLEIGGSYRGRQAISKFRKVHTWADYKNNDGWWIDEWKERRKFDSEVNAVRVKVLELPSIPAHLIENDPDSREALSVLLSEAERRHGIDNLDTCELVFRNLISIYGGGPILALYSNDVISNRQRIPSLLSTYFIERALVQDYGDALVGMK